MSTGQFVFKLDEHVKRLSKKAGFRKWKISWPGVNNDYYFQRENTYDHIWHGFWISLENIQIKKIGQFFSKTKEVSETIE